MTWLYLLGLVIIGAVVVVLIGKWDGAAAPSEESPAQAEDAVDQLLRRAGADGLTAQQLDEVQFDSALRGYRMDQVDKLLSALAHQLRAAPDEDDIRPESEIIEGQSSSTARQWK
ncbi:MAG: DivIVA domain-containing protein [Nesterenkonia sp.]